MSEWTSTDQVTVFAERALPLLSADPVGNTVALSILDWLLAGRTYSDATPYFAWYTSESGQSTGAVLMTPPYELLLAAVPPGSMMPLVAHLRETGVEVPGVRAAAQPAQDFLAAWTRNPDVVAQPHDMVRLFGLGALTPHEPSPPGHARLAAEADAALITSWWQVYQREAETHLVDVGPLVTHAIADGLLWVWVDKSARPVAMAGRKAPVAGASRIGPVFTPPEQRCKGYGGAVTAACASAALAAGVQHVLLFTDLANPVSNLIYQRIGFTPISDSVTVLLPRGS